MRYLIVCIAFVILALGSGCRDSNSPSNRAKNEKYLKETLGLIILDYAKKHGEVPENFEEAHDESGIVLPNRGDYFGQSLAYRKIGKMSFYLHSYGANRRDDGGKGDDIYVEYKSGVWSPP